MKNIKQLLDELGFTDKDPDVNVRNALNKLLLYVELEKLVRQRLQWGEDIY